MLTKPLHIQQVKAAAFVKISVIAEFLYSPPVPIYRPSAVRKYCEKTSRMSDASLSTWRPDDKLSFGGSSVSPTPTNHSAKKLSLLNSQILCIMHEAAITAVIEFTVRSTRFKNLRKRPFHLPNIFSTDIRALLRRKLKCLWKFGVVSFTGYPFINHLSSGYARSPRITGFISRPSKLLGYCRQIVTLTVHDSKGLSLTELERHVWALQGDPTTMSRNKYLASTYACIITLWNDFRLT